MEKGEKIGWNNYLHLKHIYYERFENRVGEERVFVSVY